MWSEFMFPKAGTANSKPELNTLGHEVQWFQQVYEILGLRIVLVLSTLRDD